jgi:predicted O-methyltransferase YrrM
MASRVEHKWNEVMRLNKFKNLLEYMIRAKIIYPSSSTKRYSALMDLVFKNRIKTIMEIGVYTGRRAVEMINTAIIHHRPNDITYLGFDLFEEMNDDILRDQLSKRPDTLSALQAKIERTGARIHLFKGFSEETLPEMAARKHLYPEIEFVFIDGGHAVETISSDWENVRKIMTERTIVVFDDYYIGRPDLTEKFGCNRVIDSVGNEYEVEFLNSIDSFPQESGTLNIRMVKIMAKQELR